MFKRTSSRRLFDVEDGITGGQLGIKNGRDIVTEVDVIQLKFPNQ